MIKDYKPTVSAIVLNAKKQVLLTHNKDHGANFWKLPQGGVEEGESLEASVLREMKEELKSESFKLLKQCEVEYKYTWPADVQEKKGFLGPRLYFFVLQCNDENSLRPDEEELDGLKWVNLDKLPSYFTTLPEFQSTVSILVKEIESLL